MTRTQTRIAALAAVLALPTGIAAVSIASAQNATHAVTAAPVTASHADNDAETNDGPDRDQVQAGPGNVDTPEPGDQPDAPGQ